MNKGLLVLLVVFLCAHGYWCIMVFASNESMEEGNEAAMIETLSMVRGDKSKEDSCHYRKNYLYNQSSKCLSYIPKQLRP